MSEQHNSPVVSPLDITVLERILNQSADWVKADEILNAMMMVKTANHRRWLRAVAHESGWIISGNDGYKHVAHASAAEMRGFVGRIRTQVESMSERLSRVQKNKLSLN